MYHHAAVQHSAHGTPANDADRQRRPRHARAASMHGSGLTLPRSRGPTRLTEPTHAITRRVITAGSAAGSTAASHRHVHDRVGAHTCDRVRGAEGSPQLQRQAVQASCHAHGMPITEAELQAGARDRLQRAWRSSTLRRHAGRCWSACDCAWQFMLLGTKSSRPLPTELVVAQSQRNPLGLGAGQWSPLVEQHTKRTVRNVTNTATRARVHQTTRCWLAHATPWGCYRVQYSTGGFCTVQDCTSQATHAHTLTIMYNSNTGTMCARSLG